MSEEKKMFDPMAEKVSVDIAEGRQGEGRGRGRSKKKKVSFLTTQKIYVIDYKDVALLKRFLTMDRGKIIASRQSGNTAKQQRMVSQAIKRAREMALLPFVVTEPGEDTGRRYRQ
jgi:small subunit ribosomal protein S18